jgi:hypothetical protein
MVSEPKGIPMFTKSAFRISTLTLALSASAFAMLAFPSTGLGAVRAPVQINVAVPGTFTFAQNEFDQPPGIEDVFVYNLVAGTANELFRPGDQLDVVFTEAGQKQACMDLYNNAGAHGVGTLQWWPYYGACSDMVRFINNPATGRAEVWVLSDGTVAADAAQTPTFAAQQQVIFIEEGVPPYGSGEGASFSIPGRYFTDGNWMHMSLSSDSQGLDATISDQIQISVPATPPLATAGMFALLLAAGIVSFRLRQRRGARGGNTFAS